MNRGHRKSMLSDKYKFVGIYSVKCEDRIYTCIDFHTEDLKTIDSSSNPMIEKSNNAKNFNYGV